MVYPPLSPHLYSSVRAAMSTSKGSKEAITRKGKTASTGKDGRRKKSIEDGVPTAGKAKKGGDAEKEKANQAVWGKKVQDFICKDMAKDFNNKMKRYVANGITVHTCKTDANQLKCRYLDVLCIDQTRVVLKNRSKDDDFIHANWVGSPAPGATKYICTQAPLKETQEDFWHMCFTEKVSLILMLCDYKEGAEMEKCSHYFPEKPKAKEKYGQYTVTMKEKLDEPEIEETDFSVMEIKCKDESVKLKHCYMRYWVDNCAPVETEPILKLWRWVRKYHNDRPVVVHCSAGVGRTGAFVGLELASYRIGANPDTPMIDIVKELRKQRYQSIQSHVQFLYLHCLVLDYFVQEKIVDSYKESKFVEEYKRHTNKRTQRAKKQSANQDKVGAEGGKKENDSE